MSVAECLRLLHLLKEAAPGVYAEWEANARKEGTDARSDVRLGISALQERAAFGTACYGMGRAREERHGNPVRLAADPLGRPGAGGERLSLCSASGTRVERTARNLRINEEGELWREKLHIEHVDSLLLPYDTPESYDERRRELNVSSR
ncbi:MAG: hypothetical protein ACLR7Z_02200 [Bilophila wadsworthia]